MAAYNGNTRERLLDAASDVFARKGYAQATIAEICDKAQANIAGVNYHFRGKEKLYAEVWPYAVQLTRAKYPVFEDNKDPNPEHWLLQHITAMVHVTFDRSDAGRFIRILQHEVRSPSPAFELLRTEHILPMIMMLHKQIGRFLMTEDDRLIRSAVICVHSSYMSMIAVKPARMFLFNEQTPAADEIDLLAKRVFAYALGGLRAIKQQEDMTYE